MTVGRHRIACRDRLHAELPREILGRHFAVAVHEHDHRPFRVVFHDQRLDHCVLVHAELACGNRGSAALFVFVGVMREADAVLTEYAYGGRDRTLVFHGYAYATIGTDHGSGQWMPKGR